MYTLMIMGETHISDDIAFLTTRETLLECFEVLIEVIFGRTNEIKISCKTTKGLEVKCSIDGYYINEETLSAIWITIADNTVAKISANDNRNLSIDIGVVELTRDAQGIISLNGKKVED